jgi:hypothetical protein
VEWEPAIKTAVRNSDVVLVLEVPLKITTFRNGKVQSFADFSDVMTPDPAA